MQPIMNRLSNRTINFTISLCSISSLIVPAVCIGSSSHKEAEKPNVVVVVTDDQGYGDMRCHGNPCIQTPDIDCDLSLDLHDPQMKRANRIH